MITIIIRRKRHINNIAGARLNGVSLVYAIIAITVTKPLRRFFIAKILAFCLLFGVLSP